MRCGRQGGTRRCALLHALMGVRPLAMYTLKTGMASARRFARVCCGQMAARVMRGAAALVQGREEQAKISVILPCYNAGAYLSACLNSLLAQSMRDFEVIFVDDGSRDDSLALARRYAERDVRIHVFSQENQGVSAARNLGLAHARGEWITFVDGDDLLPPDAFETLLSGAAEDVDMVVCPHETFDETGRVRALAETRWYRGSAAHKRRAAALRLIEATAC
ncbi:MAG: glycosyltransferase family 2 protein [Christensenellales bacterium]